MIDFTNRFLMLAAICAVSFFEIACGDDSPTASRPQVPTRITASPSHIGLKVGDTVMPVVRVSDQDGDPITNPILSWSISAPEVISVNHRGEIAALSAGTANVTVTSGNASAVIRLSVRSVSNDEVALSAFFAAMNGSRWVNNKNWISARPVDEWHGVTVNSEGRVEGLEFVSNGLRGELPRELGDLGELKRLVVVRNHGINGQIPEELGRLTKLRLLQISTTAVSGSIPSSLGDLQNLTTLYLTQNQLSGDIPLSLGNLSSLVYLSFASNKLSGEIPQSFGNFGRLLWLSLDQNQLRGEIPASLGRLPWLTRLDLSNNGFSGSIPSELGNLSNLEFLDLGSNGLSGQIPPRIGALRELERMFLSANLLSGPVPPGLGGLRSLWQLDLSNNSQLTGPLPIELINLTNLRSLWLSGTGLCAPLDPDFQEWLEMVGQNSGLRGVDNCLTN